MTAYVIDFLGELINYAKSFNVDPIVFIIIYFGTTPFILIPVYFLGRIAMKKTDKKYFSLLLVILILAILAPYLYVLVFGVGINIAVKLGIIFIALLSLIRFLEKKVNIRVISFIRARLGLFKKDE